MLCRSLAVMAISGMFVSKAITCVSLLRVSKKVKNSKMSSQDHVLNLIYYSRSTACRTTWKHNVQLTDTYTSVRFFYNFMVVLNHARTAFERDWKLQLSPHLVFMKEGLRWFFETINPPRKFDCLNEIDTAKILEGDAGNAEERITRL